MKKETWKIIAILGLLVIGASIFAGLNLNNILNIPATTTPTEPGPLRPGTTVVPPEGKTYDAAAIKYGLQNAITDGTISGGNERMDISLVQDGIWDPMSKTEQVSDLTAQTGNSGFTYNYGDTLVLHVSSDNDETGGTDCYDSWYIVTLVPGEPVYEFGPSQVSPTQTSPTYKYSVNSVGAEHGTFVQYIAGDTPYWGLGALTVTPRTTAANLDTYLTYGGTTMCEVDSGTDWDDDQSEQDNDVTLATDNEDLTIKLVAGATNIAYGSPMYTVSSIGKFEARKAVVIITTNATSIGVSELTDNGWSKLQDSTLTSEVGFYKTIPAQVPTKGQKFSLDITVQIDASSLSSSTVYNLKVWVIDFQLPSNVAIGAVSTSIPTAYGMVGEYGLDAVIFAKAYSTSSGAGSGEIIEGDWTTA